MKLSKKLISLILGPLSFICILLFFHPEGLSDAGRGVLATVVWVAIWWITEAIPIAATSMMPIVLFPLTGGLGLSETTALYGHKFIFLFIGGFILAIAIEKWDLHKRIALLIIKAIGTNIVYIILGFMVSTAFLSMWISNVATAVMIMPVGLAIVSQFDENSESVKKDVKQFGMALMLAIAYSASIGGMATLVGTSTNLVLVGVIEKSTGYEITFLEWFCFGFPVSISLLIAGWVYLTKFAFSFKHMKFPGGAKEIDRQLDKLGKMSPEEKTVSIIFFFTALAWITRSFLLVKFIPALDDVIIGIAFTTLLFILPAKKNTERIMNWSDAVKLPWGILLLFGGGLALAQGFESSGLAIWLGAQLEFLHGIPFLVVLFVLILSISFLTEITSNTATVAMLLPVLATLAPSLGIHPLYLMGATTITASCAFMLPVATPANAVVFGSGYMKVDDMIRKGLGMNLIAVVIVTTLAYFLIPLVWDLSAIQ